MNVKTFKRFTRRSLSMLLSVLMVLSLFTVCMVGGTLSASAATSLAGKTIYFDNSVTGWSNVYVQVYQSGYSNSQYYKLDKITGNIYGTTFGSTVAWTDRAGFRFTNGESSYTGYTDDITTDDVGNKLYTAKEKDSPVAVSYSTTNTITALNGYVYFNKPDNWSNVYLYIGRDNSPYTSKYSLTLVSGTIYRANVSGWASTTEGVREAFYFSENSVASSSTAITTRYNNDSGDKTQLYYCAFEDITTDNVYTPVGSSSPYDTTVSVYTDANTFWVDATLYNYRNYTQIIENSDYANGQSNDPFNAKVFGDYNTAVSDWYKKAKTNGEGSYTDTTKTPTPLYQGNFRQGSYTNVNGTVDFVRNSFNNLFYYFVSVANGTNRLNGTDLANHSTRTVAINLVDKTLNSNDTITQNGVELPQFSDTFMETYNNQTVTGMYAVPNSNWNGVDTGDANKSRTFGTIQTKYDDLKFQFKTTETTAGNKKYSYQANDGNGNSVDGNRYYDAATKTIRKGEPVYGCKNDVGAATTNPGYFPFNKSNPSTKSEVVNSFGTRFDIEFTMPSADSGNGYQLQGSTGNYEDLTFSFEGDDDVWVYIDGYLALDLGGSHNTAGGSINLSNFSYTVNYGYYKADYQTQKNNQYNSSTDCSYISASTPITFNYNQEKITDKNGKEQENHLYNPDLVASLKNTNKTHKITVFYLERGMFDSNFKMEFMLPQSNKLIVNEDVDASDVNAGLKTKTMAVANKDVFDVQVKTDSTSTPKTNTVKLPITDNFTRTSPDGTTTTTLQNKGTSSGTVTNKTTTSGNLVGVDAYYSWIDNSGNSSGSGIGSPSNGSMYLLYDQTGVFYDQFAVGCNMSVVQSDTLKQFGTTYNSSNGLLGTTTSNRTVSKYYDTSYTVKDVYDKDITVTESSSGTGGQFVYHNSGQQNENQVRVTVDYTNKIKTGDITFTKTTDDSGKDKDDEYTFQIEICNLFGDTTDTSWTPAKNLVGEKTYIKDSATVTESFNTSTEDGKFGIKKGQTVTFKGIPVGTKYKITEVIDSNDNYGISKITSSSSTSFTNEGNGFVVTDKTVAEDTFTVENTYSSTQVVFRFYDRKIVDGQPTSMEDHYTYFTREVPGDLLTSDKSAMIDGAKEKVINYAPTIKNVFKNYTLAESDIVYDTLTLSGNEEGTGNITNGNKYIIATYVPVDRTYTSHFTYYNEDGTGTSKTVTKSYNQLIDIDNDNVFAEPFIKDVTSSDSNDTKEFLYWAKEVDVYTGDKVETYWTPVTTNYYYSYRVVDDSNYLAVYTGDVVNGKTATKQDATVLAGPYEQLSKITSVPKEDENGNIIKDENGNIVWVDAKIAYQPDYNGYAASTNERIYDSYSIDQSIGSAAITKIDRTRVNIMFGSVGSPDTDTEITNVGYILFRNDGSYADTSKISSTLLETAASYANSQNTGDKKEDSITKSSFQYGANASVNGSTTPYRLMITDYKVNNVMTNDNYTGNVGDYNGYTGKENQINLTNKNRLNIVFDIINNETTQKAYYTCYTYMYRNGYLYISPTPATFNLKDAEPMVKDPDVGKTTYPVEITSVDTDGKATSYGTVTSNFTTVTDGKKITLTVKTAQVGDFVGELKKLEIGNKSVDVTSIASGGTYVYTFSTAALEDKATSLNIKATFDGVAANGIKVNVPTVENCSITTNPDSNFIEYNNSITVTVTPASGYAVKETNGFTVDATTGVATKTITVTESMTADELTTAMTPEIMETPYKLTVKANTGGNVTVTTADGTTTVTSGSEEVISIDKALSLEVTLSAKADANYNFAGWEGASTDSTVSTTITVTSDTTITANFTKINSTFKVNVSDDTYGKIDSVKVDGTALTADSNGYYTAPIGATVTIIASALNSSKFNGWTGGTVDTLDSTTTTFTVSETDGIVYTANFMPERTVYFAFIDQEKHKGTSEEYDKSYPKDTVHGVSGSGEGYWSSIYADFGNNDSAGTLNSMTYEGVWRYNDRLATVYSLTFTNDEDYIQFRASANNNSYDRTVPTGIVDNAVYFANGSNGGRTSTTYVDRGQWTEVGDNTTNLNDFIGTTIYFTNNLNSSGDRWAIHYYNDAGATGWVNMTNIGGNQYKTDSPIPDDCDKFIVCRMNGSATGNNWDNCWNQSYELNVSTGNYVTTTGWTGDNTHFNVTQSNS
ncbi:MAG: fibro-slime domain-containing protein [Acutalibacteraceae bacterium]|nr:fibro-slime domain-containing protein [Acutalibacteraceae bacterium]